MSTRILVVDDTAVFRRIVTGALQDIPGVEVVGTASNGKIALSHLTALDPDLMTLDIEMPAMNGIQVLEAMRGSHGRTGVVLLSAHTARGSQMTIRGLELGAFDFLTKPDSGTPRENTALLRERLVPIIRAFERRRDIRGLLRGAAKISDTTGAPLSPAPVAAGRRIALSRSAGPPMVLIGVSTGGPTALAALVPALPAGFGAPVFIVQHMPPLFTQALATSLSSKSAVPVKEAADGDRAEAGRAYLAPGGAQMKLARGAAGEILIRLTDDPPENNCKPAVDYLFRSAALQFPGRSVAVVLTGMGSDGTAGLKLLKRSGCVAIAQDEASCVVFGMPREAIHAGVVDIVAPLDQIAPAIVRSIRETGP